MPVLGDVCRLANYSVAYEETQLNRVSDFRDLVCSLFPKAIRFDFYWLNFKSYHPCLSVPWSYYRKLVSSLQACPSFLHKA